MQIFADCGYTLEEALSCATCHNAKLLNIEERAALHPGKEATFTLYHGDVDNWGSLTAEKLSVFFNGVKLNYPQ